MNNITNTELLIVRHLKRNRPNYNILKRLVGRYYALYPIYVGKEAIFNCLFDIIEKFDLLNHTQKGRNFFIYKLSFEPDFEDEWDAWIYRAKGCIRLSAVNKFPRYPEPSYFRNHIKN